MRKKLILIPAFFLLIYAATILTGKVISISDGDTITILTPDKTQVKIRLYGIDCPEKNQAYGTRAKQYTSELVFQKRVKVIQHTVDRYGRIVGEVILEDGGSLNKELVRAGLAWWYRQYAPNDKELARLEAEARQNKIGLWSDKDPIPPWDFRKGAKAGNSQAEKK